jgi:PAS domain S-box-containing protein
VTRGASDFVSDAFDQPPALQSIYDTAPIGLAFLSPDCRYIRINQRLTEICGISVEDHINRSVRDCVPALADAVESIIASIMKTGEPVIGVEVAGQRADQNEERYWITYWHPMHGPGGDIVGVNVAAEEITERKRAETALEASAQEIRRARDTAEAALQHLQEMQNSLVEAEKLAALGRLVAGVAHEINNPIGVSLTIASTLERRGAMFGEEVAQGDIRRSNLNAFLHAIRDGSAQLVSNLNRAAELVQSFKQVAADRSVTHRRLFDVGELTEQVLLSLRPGLRKQRLTVNVDCEPGLMMDSFPGSYGQVLTNLFLNSVMHAFPDERDGTIAITVQAAESGEIEIVFSDDGCGMSFAVRREAFNPFFTTRRDQGCSGLGLHIVHNNVTNRLGGRLSLDSDPGEGTHIRMILPRVAPAELSEASSPASRPPAERSSPPVQHVEPKRQGR